MKLEIKKLGAIDWGEAHVEAQPHRITLGDAVVEVYVTENWELALTLPTGTKITVGNETTAKIDTTS